jgi:hypothetical protein
MSLTALSQETLKMKKHPFVQFCLLALVLVAPPHAKLAASEPPSLFERKNIVAWCIVPFDSVKRGPAERAEMVRQLGITKVAYDWRGEHVPQFEQEILEYKKHGLEYFAFWSVHEEAFRLFEKYQLHPQIWILAPSPAGTSIATPPLSHATTVRSARRAIA